MKRKLYILTDGEEVWAVRAMTYEESCIARREAANATGGNVNWMQVCDYTVREESSIPTGASGPVPRRFVPHLGWR